MNILACYALNYLWLNKKRTGVTILGVILSSALICGVILLGISFQQMMIDRAIGYIENFHAMFQGVPVEKVVYIANHQKVDRAMVTLAQPGIIVVVSEPVFEQMVAKAGVEIEDIGPGDLYFKTNDIVSLTAELKKIYPAMVGKELFYTSQYELNQREQMMEVVVNLFFYGFLTLITLVGVTNIVNTIDTNLHLRRREFAMLKSVGLTPGGRIDEENIINTIKEENL